MSGFAIAGSLESAKIPSKISGIAARGALLALAGGVALVCALMVRGDAAQNGAPHRLIPVAIPAAQATKPHWHEERGAFADRLVRGYGISAAVADEFAGWLLEAAVRQQLQPELLASLVMAESSFRKYVRSPMGAIGPAQVRADLWHSFCGGQLDDPEQNIYCGAQILAHYKDICARRSATPKAAETCALRSYNVGYGNRDNEYFLEAAIRYTTKIDRYRSPLTEA